MNNHFGTPAQLFESESCLPANCFTVKRFGPVSEGLELSFDQGPNQGSPWAPHVKVGAWRLQRDNFSGCAYKVHSSGGLVRRADLKLCQSKMGGKDFYTLIAPVVEKSSVSLVKLDLRLPGVKNGVIIKGRLLSLYSGSLGGDLIEGDGYEAVVALKEGEWLTVFYEDGAVRRFIREGRVVERMLSTESQLQSRINQAWQCLEGNESLEGEAVKKKVGWILQGMVDLINLTSVFDGKGEGQALRLMLLRDFFLKLSPDLLSLVFRKLEAALHQVDSALVDMLYDMPVPAALPAGVTDLDQARRAKERAAVEAARRARQLERSQQGPEKGATVGSKKQQTSNPKLKAKRERKQAQRR